MLRWIQLRILLGDHNVLLSVIAILLLLMLAALIASVFFVILHFIIGKFRDFDNFSVCLLSSILSALLAILVLLTLFPYVVSATSPENLPEYKVSTTYLSLKRDKYTDFKYQDNSEKSMFESLFEDTSFKGSFVDQNTGKLLHFNSEDSKALSVSVAYTDGSRYLIYTRYVPKHKLNKIQTAVKNWKNRDLVNVHVYLHAKY